MAQREDTATPALEAVVRRAVESSLGEKPLRIEPLEPGLGLRRFARVYLSSGEPATLIARVEAPEDPAGRPAGVPPEPPLEPIRALLEAADLPVPRRLGADPAASVELLEDFGSQPLCEVAPRVSPGERRALYAEAGDLVARLQRVRDPGGGVAAFERHLDAAHFAYKADLFCRWCLPERGRRPTPAERAVVVEAFARVGDECRRAPQRLAHRDFQSANLMVLGGGPRLGMIDVQGALLTAPEYDLVCLLRDSYVELDEEEVEVQLARVRPALPDAPDEEAFARRFDGLTLTRKGKDCARYLYVARERGDPRWLRWVPAALRALRRAAAAAAARDARFAALSEIVHSLPESPCAP